jgi:hypothetical protein
MNKDIKQLAEEMFAKTFNVKNTKGNLIIAASYSTNRLEKIIEFGVEMYTAGAREATSPNIELDEAIKLRGYFGKNDAGAFHHWAYSLFDTIVKQLEANNVATTTPLSSSSGDAPLNSNNSIGLITALLSGKQLVKIHEIGEKETFWCEKGRNGRNYFYVQGWGSALGRAEDRVFDVIDNPEKWRIELQNPEVSDTTKGDSSKEAGKQKEEIEKL